MYTRPETSASPTNSPVTLTSLLHEKHFFLSSSPPNSVFFSLFSPHLLFLFPCFFIRKCNAVPRRLGQSTWKGLNEGSLAFTTFFTSSARFRSPKMVASEKSSMCRKCVGPAAEVLGAAPLIPSVVTCAVTLRAPRRSLPCRTPLTREASSDEGAALAELFQTRPDFTRLCRAARKVWHCALQDTWQELIFRLFGQRISGPAYEK